MGGSVSFNVYCLGPEDQVLVKTLTDRHVINGPGVKIVGLGKTGKRRKGELLKPTEYLRIENSLSGDIRIERGPALVFLGAYDNVLAERKAISLKHDEYVRFVDTLTGEIRVERGEKAVYCSPTEKLMDGGKKTAVAVDAETAVLVMDTRSGKQHLVTDRTTGDGELFFPTAYDEILSVRKLVKLAEYETVIVKDRVGQYHFVSGVLPADAVEQTGGGGGKPVGTIVATGDIDADVSGGKYDSGPSLLGGGRKGSGADDDEAFHIDIRKAGAGSNNGSGGVAFFLPPYCQLVEVNWSTGIHKDKRNMRKTVFDSRPWFCNYEFVCRTADNVELTLEITFFWSLDNVPAMIRNTDDAPGDMCHHARSEIVQSVSQVDLRTFMERFNPIVKDTVMGSKDPFYTDRGVRVHSVEVRSFQCRDGAIDKVLQQIIKETTDRINRLQKIESDNEVRLEEMRGRIETERLKGGLIDVQNEHQRKEALMEGEAEAERIRAFIEGLGKDGSATKEDAIALFNLMRKVDIFKDLSTGDAHMYFTPEDADLKFGQNIHSTAAAN